MRYIYQHIDTILKTYDGSLPLTHFLKSYLKQHPKLGSRDRKLLSEMAYCWYRCERGFDTDMSFEDKLHATLYLCGANLKMNNLILPPQLHEEQQTQRNYRLNKLNSYYNHNRETKTTPTIFHLEKLWKHTVEISDGIDTYQWLQSMLSQPRMFIRVRKNKENIITCLQDNQVDFTAKNDCISLPNGTALENILQPADYVVQDASSQETGKYFLPKPKEHWWDCCSGAGGKSILLKDTEPTVELTVSDKRNTILHNLLQRFKLYNHKLYASHVLDMNNKAELQNELHYKHFDGVICDVPCSGSGTWARTPEQLYFFDSSMLTTLNTLQKEIASNAAKRIAPGGKMIYITCSIFKSENEDVVQHILKYKYSLKLTKQLIINGTSDMADSMFLAVLEKEN